MLWVWNWLSVTSFIQEATETHLESVINSGIFYYYLYLNILCQTFTSSFIHSCMLKHMPIWLQSASSIAYDNEINNCFNILNVERSYSQKITLTFISFFWHYKKLHIIVLWTVFNIATVPSHIYSGTVLSEEILWRWFVLSSNVLFLESTRLMN